MNLGQSCTFSLSKCCNMHYFLCFFPFSPIWSCIATYSKPCKDSNFPKCFLFLSENCTISPATSCKIQEFLFFFYAYLWSCPRIEKYQMISILKLYFPYFAWPIEVSWPPYPPSSPLGTSLYRECRRKCSVNDVYIVILCLKGAMYETRIQLSLVFTGEKPIVINVWCSEILTNQETNCMLLQKFA